MELGMIGLGRMGANMAQRLVRGGHRVAGFDPGVQAREQASRNGIDPADSLVALVAERRLHNAAAGRERDLCNECDASRSSECSSRTSRAHAGH